MNIITVVREIACKNGGPEETGNCIVARPRAYLAKFLTRLNTFFVIYIKHTFSITHM